MANKVILNGNVGSDPEIRTTQDGETVASFRLATTKRWKGEGGERREHTEWHNVVVFGGLAKHVVQPFVKKGSKLYIEGHLKTREWLRKVDVEVNVGRGTQTQTVEVPTWTTEVVVDELELNDRKDS